MKSKGGLSVHSIILCICICIHTSKFISRCISEVYALELPTSQRRPLLAGRSCSVKGRVNFVQQQREEVESKININASTVVDLADLRALSLDRKHFTCRFTGLPRRLYGREWGSHKYTHKRFPSHEGATDFTDFQKRGDFIHIAFQISQRSFTDF